MDPNCCGGLEFLGQPNPVPAVHGDNPVGERVSGPVQEGFHVQCQSGHRAVHQQALLHGNDNKVGLHIARINYPDQTFISHGCGVDDIRSDCIAVKRKLMCCLFLPKLLSF